MISDLRSQFGVFFLPNKNPDVFWSLVAVWAQLNQYDNIETLSLYIIVVDVPMLNKRQNFDEVIHLFICQSWQGNAELKVMQNDPLKHTSSRSKNLF